MIPAVPKPPIKITESRYIPKAIRDYVDWRDGEKCFTSGCDCTTSLEYDHDPAWHLLEPKRHDPDRIFLKCEVHHDQKSKGDTKTAAKWKRVGKKDRGEWRATKNPLKTGRKLQSPGFRKGGPKQKIRSPGFQKKAKSK